jgi:hypothetical protein
MNDRIDDVYATDRLCQTFDAHGYVVLEGLLKQDVIDACRAELEDVLRYVRRIDSLYAGMSRMREGVNMTNECAHFGDWCSPLQWPNR